MVEKQKNTNQRGYGIDDSELANDSELDDFLNGFGKRGNKARYDPGPKKA